MNRREAEAQGNAVLAGEHPVIKGDLDASIHNFRNAIERAIEPGNCVAVRLTIGHATALLGWLSAAPSLLRAARNTGAFIRLEEEAWHDGKRVVVPMDSVRREFDTVSV